jgi:acyl-coenzyme A synthetase/AMP-(fatty) acid ligase
VTRPADGTALGRPPLRRRGQRERGDQTRPESRAARLRTRSSRSTPRRSGRSSLASTASTGRPGQRRKRIYRTGDLARRDQAGVFHRLGRRDIQIKRRGYRIELGEIESAIRALPDVAECAVLGVPTDRFEGVSICCALPAVPTPSRPPASCPRGCGTLPTYMLPARWQLLAALRKNPNGKIDRSAVQEMFAQARTAGTF